MRRDVLRLVAVLCLFALIGCGGSGAGVTAANFEKIQNGMTLAEVEAILGGKGVDATDPVLLLVGKKAGLPEGTKWKKWQLTGPEIKMIGVAFLDGKVASKAKMGL